MAAWLVGTSYLATQQADDNGVRYTAVIDNVGVVPSSDDGTHWARVTLPSDGMVVSGLGPAYVMAGGAPVMMFESQAAAQAFMKGGL